MTRDELIKALQEIPDNLEIHTEYDNATFGVKEVNVRHPCSYFRECIDKPKVIVIE